LGLPVLEGFQGTVSAKKAKTWLFKIYATGNWMTACGHQISFLQDNSPHEANAL
jgi:hypothetical protein